LKEEIRKHINNSSDDSVIFSPLKGEILSLSRVPDDTFSQKMMGEGVCIDPAEGKIYSPCDGEVAVIFKTNHAVSILADNGAEILVHIGIDTVKMNGEGFRGLVNNGDRIKAGQLLIEFDLGLVKARAKSHLTPIVVTNSSDLKQVDILKVSGKLEAQQPLFRIRK
jgi:glucose PTS system EIICBA or EIICB component